jgi:excisionase family DNA binding protein
VVGALVGVNTFATAPIEKVFSSTTIGPVTVRYELDYEWINGPDCDPDDWCALVTPRLMTSLPSKRRKKSRRVRKPVVAVEPDPNRLALTIPEAAWLLNCSPNTVWNMIRAHELPSFMVRSRRLVSRGVIEQFISGGKS